jgi:hypothetical protein
VCEQLAGSPSYQLSNFTQALKTLFCYAVLAGLKGKPLTFKGQVQLLAFCLFELCVGIFWPSMMSMRANYVPEELRATIINIFRIPLNAFVCVVLGNVSTVFRICWQLDSIATSADTPCIQRGRREVILPVCCVACRQHQQNWSWRTPEQ